MLSALASHGADRSSAYPKSAHSSPQVAVGHRLLKITAEDELEVQPLVARSYSDDLKASDGREIWLVADARIDNRNELAARLGINPPQVATMPDSAFVLRAWMQWGQECVQHLVGSFAFAVWDAQAEEFFLARDHSGQRPLYYCKTAQSFAFATTARAVRSCPGVSSELDERQLARDLIGLPPEMPRTRFRDIQTIAPGHCLVVRREGAEQRRYWSFDTLSAVRFVRDEEYVEAFREIFDEAVRCRLRTTGGIATELSTGLDSGSVAASAARLLAIRGERITAYTAVPCTEFSGLIHPQLIADEGPYAAAVATLYPNMQHIRMDASGSNMLREMERIFPLLDLPLAAPLNNVWSSMILDHAAASGVKVMLNGALGNFAFSYTGSDVLRDSFRRGHWLAMIGQALRMRRAGVSSGRNAASLTIFRLLPWAMRKRVDPLIRAVNLRWSAIRPDRGREYEVIDQFRRFIYTQSSGLPMLMEKHFMQNQYGDYNAATEAGWGIEARDPTADKRVFEFCAAIPQEQFVVGGQGRSLVRRAMRGRLPTATLEREEKGSQAADWYECLGKIRGELAAELTLEERCHGTKRLIDLERLRQALDEWPQTAQEAASKSAVYSSALPRGMAVGYFIRRIEEEARSGTRGATA